MWSLAAFSYDSRALKPFADLTFSFEVTLRSSGAGGGLPHLVTPVTFLGRTAFMSVSAAVVRAIAARRSALALRRKSLRMFRPCQSSLSVDSIEATDPAGDGRAGGAQRVTPLAPLGLALVTSSARASATGSSMLPRGGWRALSPRVAPFVGSCGLDRPGLLAGDANAAVLVLLFVPAAFSFSFVRFFTFRGVRLSPSAKVRVPNGAFHHASASSSSPSHSDPVPSDDDVDSSPAKSRPVGSEENFANLPGVFSTALNLSSYWGSSRCVRALRSSSTVTAR